MLQYADTTWRETTDTMTTRTLALVMIGLIVCLLSGVAVAALFSGEISERAGGIVTSVLGTFATVLAGLLLFLRVETVAEKQAKVENKVDNLHHDVLNGGLRDNVKRAIHEAEAEPEVQERRIETIAQGVQKDRHDLKNRRAVERARSQIAERIRKREQGQAG